MALFAKLVILTALLSCAPAREVAKTGSVYRDANVHVGVRPSATIGDDGAGGGVTVQVTPVLQMQESNSGDLVLAPNLSSDTIISYAPDAGGCEGLGLPPADGGGCWATSTGDLSQFVLGGPLSGSWTVLPPPKACVEVPAGDGCNTCTVCDGESFRSCTSLFCRKGGHYRVADGGAAWVSP